MARSGLYRPTGFGYPYFFTAIATGTVAAGFVGVVCLFRFVRAYFPSGIAFVSTLLVWLATFHVWYMVFEPSMSHAMAMASVAGFLLLTHEGAHGVKAYVLLGALGGVVALMRWQNVVFVPVALAVSWSMHGRPRVREIAAAGAAFLLVFSPQLLYWKALYGSFFLIPQGGGYIDWTAPELEAVLFSSRHGLLSWAPVLWLGVLGLPGLEWSFGDVEGGFSSAKVVLDETFVTASNSHHSMEPRSAMAYWDNGKCYLYGSSQSQSFVHPGLAGLLGIEPDKLVYVAETLGGHYFNRTPVIPDMIINAASGRPQSHKPLQVNTD